MAVVQAFQYVISANLQNCTVNYTKDSLRATPSVMFLMPALTTLLLICNSRSLSEAKMMWPMPSACSEHTVPCRARRLPAALRNRAPFKHGTGRWLEAVDPCESRWGAPTANLFLLGCKGSANHLPRVPYLGSLNLPNISLSFFSFSSSFTRRGQW